MNNSIRKQKRIYNLKNAIVYQDSVSNLLKVPNKVNKINIPDVVYAEDYPLAFLALKKNIVEIRSSGRDTIFGEAVVFEDRPRLKSVTLGEIFRDQVDGFMSLYYDITDCPLLEVLDLSNTKGDYFKLKITDCPKLKHIIFPKNTQEQEVKDFDNLNRKITFK